MLDWAQQKAFRVNDLLLLLFCGVFVQEEELRSVSLLRDEIEKLQEEKSMLLETIEDLKQIMEQTEPKASTAQGL